MARRSTGKHGERRRKHRKGAGSLERRKGGVYIARWTVDGKRFAQSTGTKDRAEAEKALTDFTAVFRLKNETERLDAIRGKLDGTRSRMRELEKDRPALKLKDAWAQYLAAPERANRAGEPKLAQYAAMFERLVRFVARKFPGTTEARQVERPHVAAFLETIKDRAPDTQNKYVGLFRRVWATLAENPANGIVQNPFDKVKRRRVVANSRRAFTESELAAILAAAHGEMRLLFAVGIYTGLRLGDCALLEWDAVDMARRIIRATPRKTAKTSGATVFIPIHPALLAELATTDAEARRGYVLPELAQKYLAGKWSLLREIKRVFVSCGIETNAPGENGKDNRRRMVAGFHSLRHSFVSMAANAGAPLAVVQSIVGHGTTAMTRRYFHESENALAAAVATLPDLTQGIQTPANAPASPVERTEGAERANTPPNLRTLLDALKRVFEALSESERTAAIAELAQSAGLPGLNPPRMKAEKAA